MYIIIMYNTMHPTGRIHSLDINLTIFSDDKFATTNSYLSLKIFIKLEVAKNLNL